MLIYIKYSFQVFTIYIFELCYSSLFLLSQHFNRQVFLSEISIIITSELILWSPIIRDFINIHSFISKIFYLINLMFYSWFCHTRQIPFLGRNLRPSYHQKSFIRGQLGTYLRQISRTDCIFIWSPVLNDIHSSSDELTACLLTEPIPLILPICCPARSRVFTWST